MKGRNIILPFIIIYDYDKIYVQVLKKNEQKEVDGGNLRYSCADGSKPLWDCV